MKQIPTEQAVGHVLCHDITRIVKDQCKGVAFAKGHIEMCIRDRKNAGHGESDFVNGSGTDTPADDKRR